MRAYALNTLNKCPGAQASPPADCPGASRPVGAKSQNFQNTQNNSNHCPVTIFHRKGTAF